MATTEQDLALEILGKATRNETGAYGRPLVQPEGNYSAKAEWEHKNVRMDGLHTHTRTDLNIEVNEGDGGGFILVDLKLSASFASQQAAEQWLEDILKATR